MGNRVVAGVVTAALCAVGVWLATRPAETPASAEPPIGRSEEGAPEAPTLRGADAVPSSEATPPRESSRKEPADEPATAQYVVRGHVRDRVTRQGIADVEVRGSVGTDARVLRFPHPELEATRTDADGRYELAFELAVLPVDLVCTALARGYPSPHAIPEEVDGEVYMETTRLQVTEEGESQLDLTLLRGLDIAGGVRDENGTCIAGVDIVVTAETPSSTQYIELLATDAEGRLTIHDVTPRSESSREQARPVISFTHPEHVSTTIQDAHALPQDGLVALEVTMRRGLTLRGTLFHADGSPAPGLLVETFRGDPNDNRKCAWTDPDGRFAVEGLAAGVLVLRAVSATQQSFVQRKLRVLRSDDAVVLRLEPLAFERGAPRQELLGVEFLELPSEVREVLGYPDSYALWITAVSDGAPESLREHARVGDVLWRVGYSSVSSMRDVVAGILESADRIASYDERAGRPPRETYGVRIVIGIRRPGLAGTNTQGIRVTRAEIESLRSWLEAHPEED